MTGDSTEFLVKTNKDVNEWMDSFYTDGRKAKFRLHCQWAWQENERRHRAIEAEMLAALEAVETLFAPLASDSTQRVWLEMARSAIAKAKGEPQ